MKSILGGGLVILCAYLLGKAFTENQRKSVLHLSAVIRIVSRIKDRMSMSLTTLPEIYGDIDFLTDETAFIKDLLLQKGFYQTVKDLCLSENAFSALEEFAYTLGKLDGDTQKQKTGEALARLKEVYEHEKADFLKKSKSITALFFLGGAIAVILTL